MNWKNKARIQNAIAKLPSGLSNRVYYQMQRMAGGLRRVNPTKRLAAGIDTWQQLMRLGEDPRDKTFFEVGTGWMLNAPLAYWLMGAAKVVTVDLNRYLREELVVESIEYIATHRSEIERRFDSLLVVSRLNELLSLLRPSQFSLARLLEMTGIEYHAPSDAAHTALPDHSVDYQTSFTVLEHIPPSVLRDILAEGRRILRPSGVSIHMIDYSDHFAHSDTTITQGNFLQFADREWQQIAGNRFMYMNRLRHDDYEAVFRDSQLEIVTSAPVVDAALANAIESGQLVVDSEFATKSIASLAATCAWIAARPE